jgi:hypothetical protein
LRSIGELAEHMIGGRFHWMVGMLGESNDEIAAFVTELSFSLGIHHLATFEL